MKRVSYQELYQEFVRVLKKLGFKDDKAQACAQIFTSNSLDGVYSHGLNRFEVFADYVKQGFVHVDAEPTQIAKHGLLEQWDGNFGPGMLNASFCMQRAIDVAKENGIACIALKNTNHWMRGGTYGWQAADAGCISISFTNTIAIMPPWGAKKPTIGNNPLIIAVPHPNGHIVLDMAMSQFSYGKLQEYKLKEQELPYIGGYDADGELTKNPSAIYKTRRTLPVGMWKGSGLSIMLDLLVSILSGGSSTSKITQSDKETGISQVYMCIDTKLFPNSQNIIDEIVAYTKSAETIEGQEIYYPGERTLHIRKENTEKGIPVDEQMWNKLLNA
jgi:3-dehydro-L-gulonate 2-dehydrogenase